MKVIAKKSLGQNFLIDQNIINKILSITTITNKDVLEIGPGTGNLTKYILDNNPKSLTVIEKDHDLCKLLDEKFKKKILIINEDILKIDPYNEILKKKILVFGNLPYNISTEIICNWIINLRNEYWFDELVLMFQKEVADRIIADVNTSEFGRLSILSKWRLTIKKIFDIKPNSFYPKPKVDSTVLHFLPKYKYNEFKNPKNLETVSRVFFNQRRKKIKNPMKQLFANYQIISKKLKINLDLRPQNLSNEQFYQITKEYEKLRY